MNSEALRSKPFISSQTNKNDQAMLFRVKEERLKFAVNGQWSMVYCFIWLSQQAEAS